MKKPGSVADPLWFKDAIIYEAHIRAFFDSNNDGIGDIQGLTQKLDYLVDLGVTCIWLLPFFPSPLRDDGYDIASYTEVNPSYGTLEDFKEFLDAAHERGLQVVIELVINHTSDQHPWFQRARKAPPGSPERDFYVWSDTDKKFEDARIIFTDTERSNWTWDTEANAYFWHRFFSHQPDLNFDNPAVIEEVIQAMRFWLDMGVDGLRLDAIPYLVEREGTNCENLPETHAVIKQFRAAMDAGYTGRMFLAEANQWPADVRPYFGDGDECHMAFHFPLMPRIFMAVRLEDRHPITEILSQTPEIPDDCQWGMFLRNHDELTLEMVTDEERDYMYKTYSADPRMRVNIGIRRRLAPLMENDIRRMELLNSLLFSFPGTPVLYYGDEIGMGDNIYLDDRNGVRTPMQWSPDRNAGFSRANPAKLYFPIIMDPVYGYEAVNVEAQQSNQSSLYHWMRRMISLRKKYRVFGRGKMTFLFPENRSVLAYLRHDDETSLLCVANLSRFAQPARLDLSTCVGCTPVEMLGLTEFPKVTEDPYPITLAPYGFYWFELKPAPKEAEPELEAPEEELMVCETEWFEVLSYEALRSRLESEYLPRFLVLQRWFGAKAKTIAAVKVADFGLTGADADSIAFVLLTVRYTDGTEDRYSMPLAYTPVEPDAEEVEARETLCRIRRNGEHGMVADATALPHANGWLLKSLREGATVSTQQGSISWKPLSALAGWKPEEDEIRPRRVETEQSNTSVIYGKNWIFKLLRRLEDGANPDYEVGAFLTEVAGFDRIPALGGYAEYRHETGNLATFGVLHQFVGNQGDAWTNTQGYLDRYFEVCAMAQRQLLEEKSEEEVEAVLAEYADIPEQVKHSLEFHLEGVRLLGKRTAEMHIALASDSSREDFAPEAVVHSDLSEWSEAFVGHAQRIFSLLKVRLADLPDEITDSAAILLARRPRLLEFLRGIRELPEGGMRTRIHGDFHLGQVLVSDNDYYILDFEGEPTRSIEERRGKISPLKDVAGMLRSFSYAASSGLLRHAARQPETKEEMQVWGDLYEQQARAAFLESYWEQTREAPFLPESQPVRDRLLDAFLLDKALYELNYELNNRPDWVEIPLVGILGIAER